MYSIGQVAEMFGLPVSTLRYYDKVGLLPEMERESGIRRFGPRQVEALRVVECLKAAGLEIKGIKQFMDWCDEGPGTFERRRELFEQQRESVEEQIATLERVKAMIEFKQWYYATACERGSEDFAAGIPANLPPDVRAAYDLAHSQ
ncbi:MerR family transcriptional regulator [uncultured Corynebacterium sp.]|uniref:MerR family transcriptional regulator n=1 Tax=uncultured Corynebacterium sp. TaxID=159447 RepID=UPI002595AC80|nr:MerR family transcriptional regulator [uncultured Corynebacterium sp.]